MFVRLINYLRGVKPREEYPALRPFDPDSLIEEVDPWHTRVYWAIRRFVKGVWDFPSDSYYNIRAFIQRGRRGWADRDCWSLDGYLEGWLPAALKHLKDTKHGIPMSVFEGLPTENNDGYTHSDETYKIAEARWDAIMDKMIAGFEASRRMADGLYEAELGRYPLYRPAGVSRDAWKAIRDARFEESRKLELRDEAIFKEGIALFAEHFHSLWD
jgi:hypothetical protein